MRSERECRRPDFEDGTPVAMADGKDWQLVKPRVRRVFAGNDRGFKTVFNRADGGVFAALMAAYEAVQENEDALVSEYAKVELALGRYLLVANYDLSDDEVGDLLQFSYSEKDDPEGWAIREAVMGVVFGYGAPKRSAAGDASPASSTASTPTAGPSTT